MKRTNPCPKKRPRKPPKLVTLSAETYERLRLTARPSLKMLALDAKLEALMAESPLKPETNDLIKNSLLTLLGLFGAKGVGYERTVVFWLDGEPRAKIRRKDFGFDWPPKVTP